MTYRHDPDLEFFGKLESKDLNDLVVHLTHDKDGSVRLTEELTMSEAYKKYNPDHHRYWELVAAEIQCFGGNTFATIMRGGKGVVYREVLIDVCDKLKVNYNAKASVDVIESNLLLKVLTDAVGRMTPEELKELATSLGITDIKSLTGPALLAAFQAIFRAGGFKSFQLTVIVVNVVLKALIGRGLSFGAGAVLTKAASILTGPIGWIISSVWTAFDIAGAAYRVTIPAVILVAAMRQKYQNEEQ